MPPAVRQPFNGAAGRLSRMEQIRELGQKLYSLPEAEWAKAVRDANIPNMSRSELTTLRGTIREAAERQEYLARSAIDQMNTNLPAGRYTAEMAQKTLAGLKDSPALDDYRAVLSRHFKNGQSFQTSPHGPSTPDGYASIAALAQDSRRDIDAATDKFHARVDQQFDNIPELKMPPDYAAVARELYAKPREQWQQALVDGGHTSRFALNSIEAEMKRMAHQETQQALGSLSDIRTQGIRASYLHPSQQKQALEQIRASEINSLPNDGLSAQNRGSLTNFLDNRYKTIRDVNTAYSSAAKDIRERGTGAVSGIETAFDQFERALVAPAAPAAAAPAAAGAEPAAPPPPEDPFDRRPPVAPMAP